jgi:hypothetical protein
MIQKSASSITTGSSIIGNYLNAGTLKPERCELFEKLLALCEENKRVNQYK